jgi:peptidoglycan-associated lipoprotein
MLKNKKWLALAAVAMAAAVAGCSDEGTKNTSEPPAPAKSTIGTGSYNNTNASASTLTPDQLKKSVYFDYDSSELKDDAPQVIGGWAQYLSQSPSAKVRLEGNCDERGTREYNVALGERRANSVRSALNAKGVSDAQISVISYGKERPVALGHDEASWAQNRRVDFTAQ